MTDTNNETILQRRFLIIVAACAAMLCGLILALPTQAPVTVAETRIGPVAYVDARVFDGRTVIESATLVIDGGRIAALGRNVTLDDGVTRIDASNQTILPGLIDAHTHTYGDALRDSLRFGVTATLDMFTSPTTLAGKRAARENATNTREADLFSAGMLATVDGGHGTQYGIEMDTLSGPADAAGFVQRRAAEGSDYIKLVYIPYQDRIPSLDLATCRALIKAAHDAGLMAVAHVSQAVAAQELLDAGIDGLVHVFADEPVSDAFVQQAADVRLFVVPTLSVIASADATGEGRQLAEDPRIGDFLSPLQRNNLAAGFGANVPGMSLAVALDNVRRLHKGGVTILAGSDAPNPGTAHGASVHHELALLTRAGLTPVEALTAATSGPAAQFALGDRGQLQVGGRADLVVVDGNPLDDITATRALAAVYRNGRRIDRNPLSDALASALPTGPLSDFRRELSAPKGFSWNSTDDRSFGGRSSARLEHVKPDDSRRNGALRAVTHVAAGFAYPWAGAYFGPDDDKARSVPHSAALSLRLRGTPGVYRVMFFNAGSAGAPPTVDIDVTEQWRTIQIPLASVDGLNPNALSGMAIVAGPRPGDYRFDIADVSLSE